MMTFSGYPDFEYFDGKTHPISSCYQMSGYIEVADHTEGKSLISLYESKLYRFLSSLRGAGMKGILNYSLPKVDLTRSWTDQELYQHFGLTQEEIDYIEANVK
jgi:site-specific DNA-methyltransferase (adenine-specific)